MSVTSYSARESCSAAQTQVYRVLRVFTCGFGNFTVMEKLAVCHLKVFDSVSFPETLLQVAV